MKRLGISILSISLAALVGGCAGSSDSAGVAPPAADPGGGNVGFGGAQDIGQFRQILEQGEIPGENTLDANGFFSEHYTELPPPDCGQDLCLHGMLSVGSDWLYDQYQATLQVAMNTPINPADLERLPLNLVVVVDTSGSMSQDNRIGFVRQGLHLLIDALEQGDRLALVAYDGDVSVLNALDTALPAAELHALVDGLVAQGSTNIYGGLQAGMDLVQAAYDPARQNRVVLLSDGLATAGITDDETIIAMAADYIATGIGLTTIGVGQQFNVDLMRGLAERGAGNFYFLEDALAIEEVFVDEIDYFVSPLALSVNLEVVASDGYDLGGVTGTRLWKTEGNSGSMFIPGVFVASRTSQAPDPNGRRGGGSALFINMVPNGVIPTTGDVAEIRLSYRLPGSEQVIEQTVVVTNPADPGVPAEDVYYSHQAMAEQYAMYNVFLGLREATRAAASDYHCALSHLLKVDEKAAAWNLEVEDPDIAADQGLIAQFIANLEERGAVRPDQLGGETCSGVYPNDDYYEDDYYDDYYDSRYRGCSIASDARGGASFGVVLLLALALACRRRRPSAA